MSTYVTLAYLYDLGGTLFSILQSAMEERNFSMVSATAMDYGAGAVWTGLAAGRAGVARIAAPGITAMALAPQGGHRNRGVMAKVSRLSVSARSGQKLSPSFITEQPK